MHTRDTREFVHRSVLGASLLGLLGGCSSVKPVGSETNMLVERTVRADEINWPSGYDPKDATFFVHNEIVINAPAEKIWERLIHAEAWPIWYVGASDVKVVGSTDGILRADSEFTWRTMDLDFTSTVKEYKPPYRLSWESRKSLIQGYHAWLIVPLEEGGCRVVTDESQHGFLASMQGIFIPSKLRKLHDVWLAELKAKAEGQSK